MAEEEKFLTAPEAAKILGISSQTLRRWGERGVLPPHHVLPSGYRYYSEDQIKPLIKKDSKTGQIQLIASDNKTSDVEKADVKKSSTRSSSAKDTNKPLFKVYVDGATGKLWMNCYSMRSGKTNSLAFANSNKVFKRISETVDGQEILSDDDKYVFRESMHDVTVTVGEKELDFVNASIAKGVLWIQLAFTDRLGTQHPSDDMIEEARYMKWNIDDYMELCGLSDKKTATDSIRNILSLLSNAEIQWQEEVIVRDNKGKPVYAGNYKDKNGNWKPKIKRVSQTYRGSFITTRALKPVDGSFEYWINKEFARYLAHAGVIAIHGEIFRINAQKNIHSLTLVMKLAEYAGINKGTQQAGVIGIRTVLNAMPSIPHYEDLNDVQVIVDENGNKKIYEKKGGRGGWKIRIRKKVEEALNVLVKQGILTYWTYKNGNSPDTYNEFINSQVCFQFNITEMTT